MDYKELYSKTEKELAITKERIAVVKSEISKIVANLELDPDTDLRQQIDARFVELQAEEDKIIESIDKLLSNLEALDTDATESMGQN